jgi:endoglucanase
MNESTIPDLADGLGWADVDAYGMHAYMTCENSSASLKSSFTKQWDDMIAGKLQTMDQDAYASTLGSTYPWGSNMSIANNGMLFLMEYETAQKAGDSKAAEYLSAAQSQLSYLLGDNANSYCFVTGYGTLSPQDTHHRPSQVLGKTMKGMLVGGPDSNLEDPYAQSTLSGAAAAKCYADSSQSYSCNEVTVYWNSPLIYLLAGIMSH